jgi:3-dehydrotetronate 4-kinase
MILGVIADDFTGATDIASMLVGANFRTMLVIGVSPALPIPDADAVVVALKSRTCTPAKAVQDSLDAWRWLSSAHPRQCYFKYCSTFDSTPQGNIGPVVDALLAELQADFTVVCPALPVNGRTVFQGHLFVGSQLLSDSGMRNHPLTPMTDANIVRVLQAQVKGSVGLLRHEAVQAGATAIADGLTALKSQGHRYAVCDTTSTEQLGQLAEACADLALVTGGSGLASGLPAAYERRGWATLNAQASEIDEIGVGGGAAILAGSCSDATNAQVQHWLRSGRPAYRIFPERVAAGEPVAQEALAWASGRSEVLVYASASSEDVLVVQTAWGAECISALIERCLGQIAIGLVEKGISRIVVAGGETSGAVVQALKISQLRIGTAIEPGVPWMHVEGRPLKVALKSGNFGSVDFFTKALALKAVL